MTLKINIFFSSPKDKENINHCSIFRCCSGISFFFFTVSGALLQIAVLISVGFVACWTPYGLVSLWSVLNDSSKIPPEVSLLPCMLAKSSTVYNPLIYYFFSRSFKEEVKQLSWECLGSHACQVSNSVSENNIYMVSVNLKSKEVARETLQEITESRQWLRREGIWKIRLSRDELSEVSWFWNGKVSSGLWPGNRVLRQTGTMGKNCECSKNYKYFLKKVSNSVMEMGYVTSE